MAYNKIIFGSNVLIDLTNDTVKPEFLTKGKTAHDKSGNLITGENTFDSDTTDATALASEILEGKTAYINKKKLEGTMTNNEGIEGYISDIDEPFAIPNGYHDGSGKVDIDEVEKAKLVPANIKLGIEILGVTGEYGPEDVKVQAKTVTPSIAGETVLPDEDYDYLSQVTVNPIPKKEEPNAAGGITVTIAG